MRRRSIGKDNNNGSGNSSHRSEATVTPISINPIKPIKIGSNGVKYELNLCKNKHYELEEQLSFTLSLIIIIFITLCTVRPRGTRPHGTGTSLVHDFKKGSKIFKISDFRT